MKTTLSLALAMLCSAAALAAPSRLEDVERAYADMNDAYGALGLVESGFQATFEGRNAEHWRAALEQARKETTAGLASIETARLTPIERRAVEVMRAGVDELASEGALAPTHRCADAQRRDIAPAELRAALYACFDELANNLQFESETLTRVGAFDALTRIEDPARRKALFYAFVPLWRAVNGDGEIDSPYRRMIATAAQEARARGSAIDAAAQTLGLTTSELERWLVRILETWRDANGGAPIEPWDYRFRGGAADREIGAAIPLERMRPINERFYRDLGVDLASWGVIYDLAPRKGKAPLAFADYVRRGRRIDDSWRPTLVRVSGNHSRGGLGPLNELLHENGHVVHMMALRTRPAFMDLGQAVFFEAFADVPSWSAYEPAWQRKYLGREVDEATALRSLYSSVMLDVAWALFDLRMLRDASRDPNVVWTEITQAYLNVVPHPKLAWWAVRVQLVDSPGYMANYGVGAIITAHIRARIRERLGPFDTGDARWREWLSKNLLSSGYEKETSVLLREFLGGPASIEPLLKELRRMKPAREASR